MTHIQVLKPLSSQPLPLRIASECIQPGTNYDNWGKNRQHEERCLFKYTLSGCGAFENDQGSFRVPKGHGFLTPVGDPHMRYWLPTDAPEPWVFLYVAFLTDKQHVQSLIQQHGPIVRMPKATHLIKRLRSFEHKAQAVVDMTAAEAIRFTADVLADITHFTQLPSDNDRRSHLVREARVAIEAHLDSAWNVDDLVRHLGVRRETLHRAFRQHLGEAPGRWLQRRRMQHARDLLRYEATSVGAIAERLGFDTPSHFARAFKRVFGQTPSAVRRGEIVTL